MLIKSGRCEIPLGRTFLVNERGEVSTGEGRWLLSCNLFEFAYFSLSDYNYVDKKCVSNIYRNNFSSA